MCREGASESGRRGGEEARQGGWMGRRVWWEERRGEARGAEVREGGGGENHLGDDLRLLGVLALEARREGNVVLLELLEQRQLLRDCARRRGGWRGGGSGQGRGHGTVRGMEKREGCERRRCGG